jgi:O-antigen ligase
VTQVREEESEIMPLNVLNSTVISKSPYLAYPTIVLVVFWNVAGKLLINMDPRRDWPIMLVFVAAYIVVSLVGLFYLKHLLGGAKPSTREKALHALVFAQLLLCRANWTLARRGGGLHTVVHSPGFTQLALKILAANYVLRKR